MKLTREHIVALADADLLRLGAAIAKEQSGRRRARAVSQVAAAHASIPSHTQSNAPRVATADEHPLDRMFREAAQREGLTF